MSPVRPLPRGCLLIAAASALLALAERRAEAAPSSVPSEQAYDLGEIQSPRAIAMGGAQNALGTSTTALYQNPAGLGLSRLYHFEGLVSFAPEAQRQSYGAAVVDSMTNRLAGGLGGAWSQFDPDGIRRTWTDVRLALAYPLGDRLSIGASARYLRVEQAIARGPLGTSLASDGTAGAPVFNSPTFDVGLSVAPAQGLRIGAVAHNLTNPGTALAPLNIVGGIGYTTGTVAFEVDALADLTTWKETRARVMAGGEVFLAGHVPLRLGYRYDGGLKAHSVSAGLGYIDARWSIEIGGRRDLTSQPFTMLGLSLRYFYDLARAPQEGGVDATF